MEKYVAAFLPLAVWGVSRLLRKDRCSEEKSSEPTSISIIPPDDFHLHLRDGKVLDDVVGPAAEQFSRAIIMPNLTPPVVNAKQALAYRDRILAGLKKYRPDGSLSHFTPLMTLYLTDKTTPQDIREAKATGHVYACKLYPAGATTNSDSGVTDVKNIYPALQEMAKVGLLLLVHCEVTSPDVDIFEREGAFIDTVLNPLLRAVPDIKLVLEHVTTQKAVEFVKACGPNVAATITAHHLLYNRNRIFLKGINPHYYCLPILKTEPDRQSLIEAATSGNPKFFAGTDSAPHAVGLKETSCGCAGCYTSFAALELYTETFATSGKLHMLEQFCSVNGARFYGLPLNRGPKVKLVRHTWDVPATLPLGDSVVVPLRANEKVLWKMERR